LRCAVSRARRFWLRANCRRNQRSLGIDHPPSLWAWAVSARCAKMPWVASARTRRCVDQAAREARPPGLEDRPRLRTQPALRTAGYRVASFRARHDPSFCKFCVRKALPVNPCGGRRIDRVRGRRRSALRAPATVSVPAIPDPLAGRAQANE